MTNPVNEGTKTLLQATLLILETVLTVNEKENLFELRIVDAIEYISAEFKATINEPE